MDLEYFQKWLDKYMNFERAPDAKLFRLETTKRLAGLFSHPELSYRTYHVTGSKGKGSVARMLGCVLAEMDKKHPVGVYASPHVYDFRERVGAAEGFFDEKIYRRTVAEFTSKIDSLADAKSCGSWFELNTAFAFLLFKNAGCWDAVFEVGMGGRLDATNAIKPEICCITEIELEHTEFLGDTLEKIASEKAGIIKEGTPVVVAAQKTEGVREVFKKVAAEKKAPIYFVDEMAEVTEMKYEGERLCVKIDGKIFKRPVVAKLRMLSRVQARNAMQVAVAMKVLHPELDEAVIERGLERASLPGRFEICGNVVLDGAHTVESVRETLETFESLYDDKLNGAQANLLFGIAEGKDVRNIVALFKGKFKKIFVTKPGNFKKSDVNEMREAFLECGMEVVCDEDYEKIINQALLEGGRLLATGSFYLLNEVDKILKKSGRPEAALKEMHGSPSG